MRKVRIIHTKVAQIVRQFYGNEKRYDITPKDAQEPYGNEKT